MKNVLLSVALITVAIVNMAASASTEDRLISASSGEHVEFLVEGTGPGHPDDPLAWALRVGF